MHLAFIRGKGKVLEWLLSVKPQLLFNKDLLGRKPNELAKTEKIRNQYNSYCLLEGRKLRELERQQKLKEM